MKKIFTLMAMALCTLGVGAQTSYTFESADAGKYTKTTELDNGITIYASSEKNITIDGSNKTATVNGAEQTYTHRLKFGGTGAADRCIGFKVNGSADITLVATSSNSSDRAVMVYAGSWGGTLLSEVSAPGNSLNVQTLSYTGDATTIYVGSKNSGSNIYGIYVTDKSGAPMLTVSPASVTFSLSPMNGNVQADTVRLTGKNLEIGTYYVEQPGVNGLYINPDNFTVEDGTVDQEFEILYMTDADVEKSSANFIFNAGDASAKVTVNYQSRSSLYNQELVTGTTAWNWESLTGPEVELSESTSPMRSPEVGVVMANLEDRIDFNSDFTLDKAKQIVLINTQYPSRKKAVQNGMVKFTTNIAGTISVDFSDTGSSGNGYKRYLNVNGQNTEYYTMRDGSKSDRKVASGIAVEPGNVFIKARGTDPSKENPQEADVAIMIYKITFTPASNAVADPSIEINDELAPGGSVATAIKSFDSNSTKLGVRYNLAGQQVSQGYKGIVVVNGKKVMQ